MLTNEEAKYLLKLEKVLFDPNQVIDLRNKKNRLDLISHQDNDYKFWLEITSNSKIILKTSIHHLESNSFIGLLRVDFNGRHQNPFGISETLPLYLRQYEGKFFNIDEPHLHVYVEGYKPLSWAVPIKETNFETTEINEISDLTNLIVNFAKEINLNSKLHIQQTIL
ncbi:DUF6978 family protein [Flavobacterium koreense]